MKSHSRSRSMLRVDGKYRNGAGQVRQIIRIEREVVTFRVVDPGPDGDRKNSRLLMDHHYQNTVRSFEQWAFQEVP